MWSFRVSKRRAFKLLTKKRKKYFLYLGHPIPKYKTSLMRKTRLLCSIPLNSIFKMCAGQFSDCIGLWVFNPGINLAALWPTVNLTKSISRGQVRNLHFNKFHKSFLSLYILNTTTNQALYPNPLCPHKWKVIETHCICRVKWRHTHRNTSKCSEAHQKLGMTSWIIGPTWMVPLLNFKVLTVINSFNIY